MTTIAEQLREIREGYERELEEIRADRDLTPEAKARRIGPLYEAAKEAETELREQRMAELRERVAAGEREVFAPPKVAFSDPALQQLNYRNALDLVEELTDPRKLDEKLERANLVGDRALARAVLHRANALQHAHLVQKCLDADEEVRRAWESWAEAYTELEQVKGLGEGLAYGYVKIERPPELPRTLHERAARPGVPKDAPRQSHETLQEFAARRG